MRCISKIEKLNNNLQSQLFTSISSESPMSEGHVSILTSDRPGFTLEDPMAFVELPALVQQLQVVQAGQDHRNGTINNNVLRRLSLRVIRKNVFGSSLLLK
jgi:hypothetical protein